MAKETTVGQRFTQLINHLGLSKNAFAMSLDKTATVIQHLVDERNKPGFDLLCKVFEVYPNVSKDWLLEGREPMLTDETAAATAALKEAAPATTAPKGAPVPVPPAAPESKDSPELHQEPAAATPTAAEAARAPVVASVAVPMPVAPAAVEAVAPAVAPQPASAPAGPAPVAAPAPAPVADTSWQTALYTQQMAHQLAMAEMRNQHLLDQQRMMQQMMDLMQRQLS